METPKAFCYEDSLIIDRLNAEKARLQAENKRLLQWVNDLQSGMYINCVYCGQRYGPQDKVAATMQEALYQHIATCPKHPLAKANAEIERLKTAIKEIADVNFLPDHKLCCSCEQCWTWARATKEIDCDEEYNKALAGGEE